MRHQRKEERGNKEGERENGEEKGVNKNMWYKKGKYKLNKINETNMLIQLTHITIY